MIAWLWNWLRDQTGQGLIEYAAIVGVLAIALATATAAGFLDGPIAQLFTDLGNCIDWEGSCP